MKEKNDFEGFSEYREFELKFESDFFNTNGECNLIRIDVESDFVGRSKIINHIYKIYDETAQEIRNIKDFPENERHRIFGEIEDYATELFYS